MAALPMAFVSPARVASLFALTMVVLACDRRPDWNVLIVTFDTSLTMAPMPIRQARLTGLQMLLLVVAVIPRRS